MTDHDPTNGLDVSGRGLPNENHIDSDLQLKEAALDCTESYANQEIFQPHIIHNLNIKREEQASQWITPDLTSTSGAFGLETRKCYNREEIQRLGHIQQSVDTLPIQRLGHIQQSVDTLPIQKYSGCVSVTLDYSDLWQDFGRLGTEMIINRGGRRMFPNLVVKVQGLNPDEMYSVVLEIIPADKRRFKFVAGCWESMSAIEPEAHNPPYFHPDSPSRGSYWMESHISFARVKLTNSSDSADGNMLLQSMHKYMMRLSIRSVRTGNGEPVTCPSEPMTYHTFLFPETTFVAVTAYQNLKITQLKIHNNPFAKAFRGATSRTERGARKRKSADNSADDKVDSPLPSQTRKRAPAQPMTSMPRKQSLTPPIVSPEDIDNHNQTIKQSSSGCGVILPSTYPAWPPFSHCPPDAYGTMCCPPMACWQGDKPMMYPIFLTPNMFYRPPWMSGVVPHMQPYPYINKMAFQIPPNGLQDSTLGNVMSAVSPSK